MQTFRIQSELNTSAKASNNTSAKASKVEADGKKSKRIKAVRTNKQSIHGKCATKKRTSNFDFVGVAG